MKLSLPLHLVSSRFGAKLTAFAFAVASMLALSTSVHAGSATWTVLATGTNLWSTSADWSTTTPPGATTGTSNGDTAIFNGSTGVQTITVDSNRNVMNISFGTGAGYTFNGQPLLLSSGGSIMTGTASAGTMIFANSLTLEGNYTFSNNTGSNLLIANTANGLVDNATNIVGVGSLGNTSVTLTLSGTAGTQAAGGQVVSDGYTSIAAKITDGGAGSTTLNILKSGPGTWGLVNGANTYGGSTTIDGGVLNFITLAVGGSASSIGSSSNAAGNLIFNGGTLQYTGYTGGSGGASANLESTDRLFTIGDSTGSGNSATLDSSADNFTALDSNSGTMAFTNKGAIAFYSGTTTSHSLILTGFNLGNNTFAPQLTDQAVGAATSLTKSNQGTWVLTNTNNTYSGLTSILGGVLRDGSTNGQGISPNSTVLINNAIYESATNISRTLSSTAGGDNLYITGGEAGFGANNATATPITVTISNGGQPLQFGSANFSPSIFVLNGPSSNAPITFATGLDLNGGNQTIANFANAGVSGVPNTSDAATVSGPISSTGGGGSLNKIGTGIVNLTGTNTYTGGTGVDAGVLSIGSNSSIGSGGATVYAGAELRLSSTSNVASGKTVVVNNGGALGLASNTFTESNLASIIDPSSNNGILAIDTAGFGNYLDLTTLGNGTLSLGSTVGTSSATGGVFSGTLNVLPGGSQLAANATFGTTYHLGAGGGWLTIAGLNTLTDQPAVYLGTNPTNALFTQGNGNSPSTPVTYSATSNTRSSVQVGYNGGLGAGNLDLANQQSYTGVTTVNNSSTLALDFSGTVQTPSSTTNILNSGNEVDLAGGTLWMIGSTSGASSQTLAQVKILNGGNDIIQESQTGNNVTTLNLGILGSGTAGSTITADTGSSALISAAQGGTASATITTTTTPFSSSTDAGLTYGGQIVYKNTAGSYTWATGTSTGVSGGNAVYTIGAYTGDTSNLITTATAAGKTLAASDYYMTATFSIVGANTINLLRVNNSAAATLNTGTGGTLQINGGGILFTGSNSVTLSVPITSGEAAVNGYNFMNLQNYLTAGTVTPGGAIKDTSGSIKTVVVYGGTGTYTASQTNTTLTSAATGGEILDGATLQAGSYAFNTFTTSVFTINSGTIQGTYDNGSGDSVNSVMVWNGNFTLGQADQLGTTATTYGLNGNVLLNNNITVTINPDTSTWQLGPSTGSGGIQGQTYSDGGYGYGITLNGISGSTTLYYISNFTGALTLEAGGGATASAGNSSGTIGSGFFTIVNTGSAANIATNRSNTVYIGPGVTLSIYGAGTTGNGYWQFAGLDDLGTGSASEIVRDGNTTTNSNITLWGSNNYSFGGSIQDTTSTGKMTLTMNGTGTQRLTGSNTYTGGNTINAGTLFVDASAGGSIGTQGLTVAGGSYKLKGTTVGTTQSMSATTDGVGGGTITVDNNGGTVGATVLNLGALTLTAGGTLDVVATNSVNGTAPTITTTSVNLAGTGTIGSTAGHVLYTAPSGTVSWATGTTNIGFSNYTIGAYTADTTALVTSGGGALAANDYLLTASQTQTFAATASLLRITNTNAGSLNLAGKALNIANNGVLFTGTASYSITDTGGGSFLDTNTADKELVINNFGTGTGTSLTISAPITNNGANVNALAISGPGTTVLTGSNTYGGTTYLNNGTINFNKLANFGTGAGITISGATLQYATGNTQDMSSAASSKTITINDSGATIDTNGNSMTYASTFGTGSGGVTFVDSASSHGTLNFNGSSGYTGFTTIGSGANVNLGGAGTFIAGTNALSGTIVANGGTLSGGETQVTNNVQGTGAMAGRITLQSGGVLAPGNLTALAATGANGGKSIQGAGVGDGSGNQNQSGVGNNVLNATSLTWNAGGQLKFFLDSTSQQGTILAPSASTLLNLGTGALVKGNGTGGYVLNFQNTGAYNTTPTAGQDFTNVYDLINFGVDNTADTYGKIVGNTNFNIDDFSIINLNGIGTLSFYYNAAGDNDAGQEELLLTVVPEPSTWAMLLGGLVALVFWTRKRSRRTVLAKSK